MPKGMNDPIKGHDMTTSTKTTKAPKEITIKAPKIVTAWSNVCKVSNKSEQEVFASIVNLHEVLTNESRLSVADKKKFIKKLEDGGTVSSFIKASHVPAIPTLMNLRKLHADFKALPIAKQLSVAMASYDILGVGKGEQIKTLEALTKEIATIRKAKAEKSKEGSTKPAKEKKDTLKEILAYFTALDTSTLDDAQLDTLVEIQFIVEGKMANA